MVESFFRTGSLVCSSKQAEDGLKLYVFLIAIKIANGTKFALAPSYLGFLYARLDE